ncbi:hypothetical protein AWR36_012395 [Microbulbifer flavimaris]|uniref:Uncharacterized protein n=1 Tax=Microbulbifer flavimaris TaxID=1781068 RepID=A0ABX4HXD7_9GAMM|nr:MULTISPECIES: hypothetical protein [Microbulbifer]KUJ82581.1 hypothetical protein AVO43_12360 [Microbulbifer sp. ZGT114]PCO04790.1 hypothetical protein AWR36_012395 [Microbulbifer flavimaris]
MGPANTQVRVQMPGRILRLTPTSEVTFAEMACTSRYLAEKFGHLSPMRILLDARGVVVRVMPAENQQIAELLSGLKGFATARIAVLHDACGNPMAATDRASQQRGLLVRQFFSEQAACHWLRAVGLVPG